MTDEITTGDEWKETPGMGRAVAMGGLVGAVLAFIATTVGMIGAGAETGAAVGLGLFIAFWGGLGFGTMVGGVTWVSQHEEH
ncbi:MAG: hypothetical protein H6519_01445 [Microthrixaceae bacterium]|nr:hypothetical protein [Acidimicrobiales bacterium]MCB9403078.1 hypothetical protein [Microthrixaceae bacterium]